MGMTLDEAIIHAEEVAQGQSELYDCYLQHGEQGEHVESCKKCAAEHRQLAEWLKDYKRLLERESCEDAISRDNTIEAVCGLCDKSTGIFEENPHIDAVLEVLENLPSVQPVACIAQIRFDEEKLKEIVKDRLRTVFDTESYASEDGGYLIRYEDAVGMVEELDFIQPKKTAGKLISIEVLDKIRAEIMELQTYKMFEGENTIYSERDDVLAIIDEYKTGEGEE